MSCCPPAPVVRPGSAGDTSYYLQESNMRRGESVECYEKRAGDSTGRMDDKTEDIADKIKNAEIPLDAQARVNVTFTLTENSTKTASSWKMYDSGDNEISNIESVPLDGPTLHGTFPSSSYGKSIKIKISALDSTGTEIDQRGFTFSPAAANGSNQIQFVHPLPGARVTSPFGPRKPPTTGASSMHGGVDFSIKPLPPGDVLAAADGEVIFTGFQAGGAGNYVKIKHLNGAGAHLCTTVYMHLTSFYVSQGQKVTAGQKIALEGNTGIGTGAHLHFECRLPNDTKVDPLPYIKGTIQVAGKTNPDNTEVDGTLTPVTSNAVLTTENVNAKQAGCEPFGATYPKDPTAPTTTATPISDPFEKAWFFTLTHEVGPQWTTASPSDPDVAAGSVDTTTQQKKVGYVNKQGFPGGETKFGIAQGPNPGIQVRTIDYATAKNTGYNNYWKAKSAQLVATKPKAAVMMFDMCYLHGTGNVNKFTSGVDLSGSDEATCDALHTAQQNFMYQLGMTNPDRNTTYLKGWLTRSNDLLAYAKGL